jgi:hypothetical protein
MSRILGFIARFVDEKLSAARVLISLLLLTLVANGSLLLAQYGPTSGFDTLRRFRGGQINGTTPFAV